MKFIYVLLLAPVSFLLNGCGGANGGVPRDERVSLPAQVTNEQMAFSDDEIGALREAYLLALIGVQDEVSLSYRKPDNSLVNPPLVIVEDIAKKRPLTKGIEEETFKIIIYSTIVEVKNGDVTVKTGMIRGDHFSGGQTYRLRLTSNGWQLIEVTEKWIG